MINKASYTNEEVIQFAAAAQAFVTSQNGPVEKDLVWQHLFQVDGKEIDGKLKRAITTRGLLVNSDSNSTHYVLKGSKKKKQKGGNKRRSDVVSTTHQPQTTQTESILTLGEGSSFEPGDGLYVRKAEVKNGKLILYLGVGLLLLLLLAMAI